MSARAAPSSDTVEPPQYPISSVDNALRLLLMFRDRPEVRLSEAADLLGVANSTAHRLLAMLTFHGFVRQSGAARAYQPGPALFDVGLAVVQRMDVRAASRPVLGRLVAELSETVHCIVLDGATARYVDAVESPHAVRVASRIGMHLPAHCSSGGKVLLSMLSDDQIESLYPDERLDTMTARSISTRSELRDALDRVRELGYAVNDEESADGVIAVAVVVPGMSSSPVAALSCGAPASRLGADDVPRLAASLRAGAERVSERLLNPTSMIAR